MASFFCLVVDVVVGVIVIVVIAVAVVVVVTLEEAMPVLSCLIELCNVVVPLSLQSYVSASHWTIKNQPSWSNKVVQLSA